MSFGEATEKQPERAVRVLVVDDNRDAADSLGTLLGLWGYDYRVAYDGWSGWETVGSFSSRIVCSWTSICRR